MTFFARVDLRVLFTRESISVLRKGNPWAGKVSRREWLGSESAHTSPDQHIPSGCDCRYTTQSYWDGRSGWKTFSCRTRRPLFWRCVLIASSEESQEFYSRKRVATHCSLARRAKLPALVKFRPTHKKLNSSRVWFMTEQTVNGNPARQFSQLPLRWVFITLFGSSRGDY